MGRGHGAQERDCEGEQGEPGGRGEGGIRLQPHAGAGQLGGRAAGGALAGGALGVLVAAWGVDLVRFLPAPAPSLFVPYTIGAERIVIELKDKAPAYSELDPAVIRLSGAVEAKRAPQPVLDAVSALVNLGYGQPQAAAAIAAAARGAGEGAETAQLIRLGLKELSK